MIEGLFMASDNQSNMMRQSQTITTIGCVGAILVVILIVLIGSVSVRMGLASRRAKAMQSLYLVQEQVSKAPGIFERMLAFGCDSGAASAVEQIRLQISEMKEEPDKAEMDAIWGEVENVWVEVNRGCSGFLNDPAFVDLTTELEGIRNRRSVEMGKYGKAVEEYNSMLSSFPANVLAWGVKPLS
jgi:hypothetical protein